MNKLDPWYQSLLSLLVSEDQSFSKSDRTGTGTKSLFGVQFRHDMSDGFPLLTTKKMAWKTMVTELVWFLRGDTNIKFLVDNDCHIWDGDALKAYHKHELEEINKFRKEDPFTLVDFQYTTMEEFINKIKTDDEFANKWGELGPIYGRQWRSWNNLKWEATDKIDPSHPDRPMLKWKLEGIDQIANLINELKTNPDSRRLMVSAWNVGELDQMVLPPCHYGFQMYTRELSDDEQRARCHPTTPKAWDDLKEFAQLTGNNVEEAAKAVGIPTRAISLMWNQRSVDTFLGLPFNIASYGLLLMMIADEVNMVPDQLIGNLGDVHLYNNHVEQAKEQISRTPFELPTVHIRDGIESCMPGDFILKDYQSHPSIKAPLSN
jgi:thymidylate synthase